MKAFSFAILLFTCKLFSQELIEKQSLLERLAAPKLSVESSYLDNAKVSSSEGSVSVKKNKVQINNFFAALSYTNWEFNWDILRYPII
ncbi:MAG: hypothetical protein U9N52_13005 [Campylobacterota bacterium]|nr:hypothetical protein [Campylobacterota bacterium]